MAIIPAAAARLAPAAGAAITDLAVRAVRPALCGLYRANPGWYTGSPSNLGRDVGRLASFAMDSLCDDQPLPPPMTVPFNGGQCALSYRVTFRSTRGLAPNQSIQTFTRTLSGKLGGMTTRGVGLDALTGEQLVRWGFIYAVSSTNPKGLDSDLSNGTISTYKVDLVSIVREDGLADNCGNPPPSDRPTPIGDSTSVNINLPDLRVSPSANVTVPVVIFRPEFNFKPDLSVDFNIKFDMGGQKFIFNGSEFRTGGDVDINFTEVNNNIASAQTNINNNASTNTTNINNNTNSANTNTRTNINNNTNTAIANSQTNINNSTNTAIASSQTNINTNTSNIVSTNTSSIINTINSNSLKLSGEINAVALALGVINANLDLALRLLGEINLKPDCPVPPSLPGDDNVDDVVKPEEDKKGDNPKIQAVTVVITQDPIKSLWGGGNGAPNKLIAGWFAWKVAGGGYLSQEHINYSRSTYIRPANVIGYAYTLTNKARGFAIEHILR